MLVPVQRPQLEAQQVLVNICKERQQVIVFFMFYCFVSIVCFGIAMPVFVFVVNVGLLVTPGVHTAWYYS